MNKYKGMKADLLCDIESMRSVIEYMRSEIESMHSAIKSMHSAIIFSSRDWSIEKRDAWIYGIIVGWDDQSLAELQKKFKWDNATVARLKKLNLSCSNRRTTV